MLDNLLLVLLIVVVPGYMVWRSLAERGKPAGAKLGRYVQAIVLALALDGLLLIDWIPAGRSARALGLDAPLSMAGMVGLGLAACVLLVVGLAMWAQANSKKAANQNASDEILPNTTTEFVVFVVFSIVVGCSWEALYRGYLLWNLTPHIGLIGSVIMAAAAYGLAHGFKNKRMFAGSILSALIFTIAYAATKSLWWLMVVHCGLPLIGAFAARARRKVLSTPMLDAATLPEPPA